MKIWKNWKKGIPGTGWLGLTILVLSVPVLSALADLIVTWSKVSGPGEVVFADPNKPATTASFSQGGDYVLRLTADDGEYTVHDDVKVSVKDYGGGPRENPISPNRIPVPLEVMSPNTSHIETVQFSLFDPPTQSYFEGQFYNIPYAGKASIKVNNTPWVVVAPEKVTIMENAFNGHHAPDWNGHYPVIRIRFDLPSGALNNGDNQIQFRFTRWDDPNFPWQLTTIPIKDQFITGGYHVLGWTIKNSNDVSLLDYENDFEVFDPQTHPELYEPDPADDPVIGANLWFGKGGCFECHGSGVAIRKFNISRHDIVANAMKAGLAEQEGKDIYAYLADNFEPSRNGRIWVPLYQPGPSLIDDPIEEWFAGAYVLNEWGVPVPDVLETGEDQIKELFGSYDNITTNQFHYGIKDMNWQSRMPMQLLAYRDWWPRIPPSKAFPGFENTDYYRSTQDLIDYLNSGGDYAKTWYKWEQAWASRQHFQMKTLAAQWGYSDSKYPGRYANRADATTKWLSAQILDLVLLHNLDAKDSTWNLAGGGTRSEQTFWRNPERNSRTTVPIADKFDNAPKLLKVRPEADVAYYDNDTIGWKYQAVIWYRVQGVSFTGQNGPFKSDIRPEDYNPDYTYGQWQDYVARLAKGKDTGFPEIAYLYLHGMKERWTNPNPADPFGGWYPRQIFPISLVSLNVWKFSDPLDKPRKGQIIEAVFKNWLDVSERIPIDKWRNAPFVASKTVNPRLSRFNWEEFIDVYYTALSELKNFWSDVTSAQLRRRLVDLGQRIWPAAAGSFTPLL